MHRFFIIAAFIISSTAAQSRPQAIIYSGLFDFSGFYVSDLAQKLRRCADVSVYNHTAASVSQVNNSGSVFLIGHSMGGIAAIEIARQSHRRIDALITLDPATHFASPGLVPSNVTRAINIWQPVGLGGGHGFGARDIQLSGSSHIGLPSNPRVESIVMNVVCAKH